MKIIGDITDNNEGGVPVKKRRIFSVKNVILLAVSIVLVYFLLGNIDIPGALGVMKKVSPVYLIISLILYFFSNLLKTLRFQWMLKGYKIKLRDMFVITSYQNFFNLILPARTGELTLVYYLKKTGGINISRGLHSLLLSRFIDLLVVAVIFIVSGLLYRGGDIPGILVAISIVLLACSVLLIVKLGFFVDIFSSIFNSISSFLRIRNTGPVEKVSSMILDFRKEVSSFSSIRDHLTITALTFAIWINLYLIFFFNIRAFMTGVSFIQVLIGATGAVLTNTLPVNSFGSFGTLEAGWTGGFLLVGMSLQNAVATGFGSHFIMLLSAAIIALICVLYKSIKRISG